MAYLITEDGFRLITEAGDYLVTEDHVAELVLGGPEGDARVWTASVGTDGINAYIAGQLVRCSVVFRDQGDTPVDPSGVVFRVRKPDGTIVAYTYGTDAEVVRSEAGSYSVDVAADLAGRWQYRFEGAGSGQAVAERMFLVEASRTI